MIYAGNLTDLSSGYAQAGLNHLASLHIAGYTGIDFFSPHGAIPWNTLPKRFDCLRQGHLGADHSVVLHHTLITELSTVLKRENVRHMGMTALDTDRCPKWCAVGVNRNLERLIVPSEHSKRAAIAGGVTIPIHVVPHTIDRSWWETPLPHVEKKAFTFYYIGSWNPRKNPEAIVKAYCQAFPVPPADVRLYLKLTQEDSYKQMVQHVARQATSAVLNMELPDEWVRADIITATGRLSEREIREIHAYGDCYVSAHRGEAFGLALLEAALLGKPVIATAWSGPVEFLSTTHGHYPVDYDLVPVRGMDSYSQFASDQQWAEPYMPSLTTAMQTAYAEKHFCTHEQLHIMREHFSWESMGPVLRKALEI